MFKRRIKNRSIYTLYVLIREQEFNFGSHLLNALWLKVKPGALPWYGSEMYVALSRILKY
jgi:hypothetical protein